MVALADWYILPILLQLEKLSGPSTRAYLRLGVSKVIHRVLQVIISTWKYGVEYTARLGECQVNL